MPHSTVQKLADAGFFLVRLADAGDCCPHEWGVHLLEAPGSPLDGGIFRCPHCPCTGTWDVPVSEADKARYRGRYLS